MSIETPAIRADIEWKVQIGHTQRRKLVTVDDVPQGRKVGLLRKAIGVGHHNPSELVSSQKSRWRGTNGGNNWRSEDVDLEVKIRVKGLGRVTDHLSRRIVKYGQRTIGWE
jgi:hypothetical protein